jgi:hypothetical protein
LGSLGYNVQKNAINLDESNQGFIICELKKISENIQVDAHVISHYFFDQLPISTDLEAKYGTQNQQEQSCIVDLYNQIENITKINDQMRE